MKSNITWFSAAAIIGATVLSGCSSSSSSSHATTETSGNSKTGSANTSSAPATPGPVKNKPFTVTVGASGDLITQPQVLEPASAYAHGHGYNYNPFFANIKGMVSAPDISICQMENPLTPNDTNLSRELSFNAPHEMAPAVKDAGFDGCSTANNHAYDRGLDGIMNNRKVMANAGLKAAGPGSNADDEGQPAFYETHGVKIAQLSYSFNLTNSFLSDKDSKAPWMAKANWNTVKAAGIEKAADAARAAGADLVLVSLHWGTEYKTDPNSDQTTLANQLLKSGKIDWIIGNHPHAVQPCQKINGRYVNYAFGNTFGGQSQSYFPTTKHGLFGTVTFTRDASGTITESEKYQPTYANPSTHVVYLATPKDHADDYNQVKTIVGSMGCDATPAE